ncbi:MAG: hypothetical protein V4456_16330 [Bacteroidota bacterium]
MEKIFREQKYLLYAAVAIFFLICYQLAFKPTIEAWQSNSELKDRMLQSGGTSGQPAYLIRKKVNLDTLVARFKIDTGLFRTGVLNKIALIAQKQDVKLVDIPTPDQLSSAGPYLIQKLVMEGNYFALLKTLNDLRSADQVGFIRSVSIRMPERDTQVKQGLAMTIYLEIIR